MPAKRVLISIDERTLARIDDAARRDGLTRSGFLAQAAMAQIEGGGSGGEPRSKAALRALDDLASDPPRR
jgi:metal-responsive CopG/Arc/MetJ family transcriptional regulator